MAKDQVSLADQFMVDSYRFPKVAVQRGSLRIGMERVMIHYRMALRNAHRFEIDDEFVRYSSEVSNTTFSGQLLQRINSAVMPYPTVWVEFNLHEKVRTAERMGALKEKFVPAEVPERCGLLFERDPENISRWAMTVVTTRPSLKDGKKIGEVVVPHPVVYLFDPQEVIGPISGYKEFRDEKLHRLMGALAWGYRDETQKIIASPRLWRTIRLGQSKVFEYIWQNSGSNRDQSRCEFEHDAHENMGFIRWAITVLAMMSEIPTYRGFVEPQGRHMVGGQSKRFMDWHRVSLKLPKRRPRQWIDYKLKRADARKHKLHEVMGHWRTYLSPSAMNKRCDHDWLVDHDNGYRLCEKCESFGRRIKEYWRGDAALGIIRKEYIVQKA
jgi:hypothetical protein